MSEILKLEGELVLSFHVEALHFDLEFLDLLLLYLLDMLLLHLVQI